MRVVVLASGSKGNCTYVDLGSVKVLIDAGISYNKIRERLNEIDVDIKDIELVLITHDHSDHTSGLKVLLNKVKPMLYISKEIEKELLGKYEDSIYLEDEIFIKGATIKIIPTSHDAITSNGYLIEKDSESLVYITDTGYINHKYFKLITDKTYYIFESNHDPEMLKKGPYPEILKQRIVSDKGHLSNELAAGYLSRIIGPNTKKVILAHLSETNNTPDIALKTVNRILKENEVNFKVKECASETSILEVSK